VPCSDGVSKSRSCGLKTRVAHDASLFVIISALYSGSFQFGTLPFVSYGRETWYFTLIIIIIIIIIIIALQPFVGPWPLFQFLDPIHSR
jgi:hypothetical protein